MNALIPSILEHINNAPKPALNHLLFNQKTSGSNEFLAILKPELFTHTTSEEQEDILQTIFEELMKYNFHIGNIRIINAAYLKKFGLIDKHYGIINSAARNIQQAITPEAKNKFKLFYNIEFNSANVWGAIQAIDDQIISNEELSILWKDCRIDRLAGGIYCSKLTHKGNTLYIVNGFHPPQLNHFIDDGRTIVTMNLSSDTNWKTARHEMTSSTYPEKAKAKSIRGKLYKKYGNYRFENVSYVLNSFHLSAGPLEGLMELQRFNSAFEKNETIPIEQFGFGQKLKDNFTELEIKKIVNNASITHKGKSISLYDLTEELNSNEAIELMKDIF